MCGRKERDAPTSLHREYEPTENGHMRQSIQVICKYVQFIKVIFFYLQTHYALMAFGLFSEVH